MIYHDRQLLTRHYDGEPVRVIECYLDVYRQPSYRGEEQNTRERARYWISEREAKEQYNSEGEEWVNPDEQEEE